MALRRYDIVLCRSEQQQMTLETLASRVGMHPALVERFVDCGLLEPVEWEGAMLVFDASAVARLHTIGRLRESLGINVAGIVVALDLLDRLTALQHENDILRSRL